ncbi:hypothetical protein BDQ17DRAFT_1350112 [Cyathus striatus]|nr:hypothetical protein BDQ17DRAFT_1350112 [Cyathus striatus]
MSSAMRAFRYQGTRLLTEVRNAALLQHVSLPSLLDSYITSLTPLPIHANPSLEHKSHHIRCIRRQTTARLSS